MLHVVEMKRTMTLRFYMLRIMPVGLFMALTLHFGNTVYLYLTVSFIQMLKVMRIGSAFLALFASFSWPAPSFEGSKVPVVAWWSGCRV